MSARAKDETPTFERLATKRKSLHVAEQILSALDGGTYKAGSKLPPEQAIAQQTGVSRPSVREALAVLRFVGVLETRVGDGTYVVGTRSGVGAVGDVKSEALSMLANSGSPFETLEARRVVETGLVTEAAERRTAADLVELENALNGLLGAIEARDYDRQLREDRHFHGKIASAAHNSVLEEVVQRLLDAMEKGVWTRLKIELIRSSVRHVEETRITHRELFEAIRRSDRQDAREVMVRHFEEIERLFSK